MHSEGYSSCSVCLIVQLMPVVAILSLRKMCMRLYAYLDRARLYLECTRSHNEGRVSTPACYLLYTVASPCQTLRELLAGNERVNKAHPIN